MKAPAESGLWCVAVVLRCDFFFLNLHQNTQQHSSIDGCLHMSLCLTGCILRLPYHPSSSQKVRLMLMPRPRQSCCRGTPRCLRLHRMKTECHCSTKIKIKTHLKTNATCTNHQSCSGGDIQCFSVYFRCLQCSILSLPDLYTNNFISNLVCTVNNISDTFNC